MLPVKDMIDAIEAEARSVASWMGHSIIDTRVLQAMCRVPKHEFVPDNLQHSAYDNAVLPIGYGQTISQPFIVALMTDLLNIREGDVVLDVGSGSGYQVAVLAQMAKKVFGIENVEQLAVMTRQRLKRLGYANVEVIWGNGYGGLPKQAPFAAILVAAASSYVPKALLDQIKPGGRMIIPVGGRGSYGQDLQLLQKDCQGKFKTRTILPVAFVPLVDQIFPNTSVPA